MPDPELADWHLGHWRGRTLDDVAADTPTAVAAWLGDPDAAPHGGETLTALVARVAQWLAGRDAEGHTVAVTHAAVVRDAVIATLGAPAAYSRRIDVAPLTATVLRGGPARWTVRGTALPLDARVGAGIRTIRLNRTDVDVVRGAWLCTDASTDATPVLPPPASRS